MRGRGCLGTALAGLLVLSLVSLGCGRLPRDLDLPSALRGLESPDYDMRHCSVLWFAFREPPVASAAPRLRRLLEDKNANIRHAAA